MVCLLMETKFIFMIHPMRIQDTAGAMMGPIRQMVSAWIVVKAVKHVISHQLSAGLAEMDHITTMKNVFHAVKGLKVVCLVTLQNV